MPARRVSVRKIRELLRLLWECRQLARVVHARQRLQRRRLVAGAGADREVAGARRLRQHVTRVAEVEDERLRPRVAEELRRDEVDQGALAGAGRPRHQAVADVAASAVSIPGFANAVAVDGAYAYVAAGLGGLQVVDVLNLFSPFVAGWLPLAGNANGVRVANSLAYLAMGEAGLAIVDVHDPPRPVLLATLPLAGTAMNLAVRAGLAAPRRNPR